MSTRSTLHALWVTILIMLAAVPCASADSRAAETLHFGWCNDFTGGFTCFRGSDVGETSAAIRIPAEIASRFDGKPVTAIRLFTGILSNTPVNYTLFITDDLEGEDLTTQEVIINPSKPDWEVFALDKPVTVTAGKPLYVGFRATVTDLSQFVLWVDKVPKDHENGCWVRYPRVGREPSWTEFGYHYGSLFIRADIEGAEIPANDVEVQAVEVPTYTLSGTQFNFNVRLANKGSNPIRKVTVEYTVDGGEPQTADCTISSPSTQGTVNLDYNSVGNAVVSDLVQHRVADRVKVTARVVKINGKADENPDDNYAEATFTCIESDAGYHRAMVMEEVTGTWCGNCPRGIVIMHDMLEKYGDERFIPIAVHIGSDPMTAQSYQSFVERYTGFSAPSAVYNRNRNLSMSVDNLQQVDNIFKQVINTPAIAKIELSADWADNSHYTVAVTANVTFGGSTDNKYRLAFALTEDGVGPYEQRNYYSEGIPMGGWEKLPGRVDHTFDHVARMLDSLDGIEGSLPDKVAKDEVYTYTHNVGLLDLDDENGTYHIIGMVIDTTTGEIVNARRISNAEVGGIDSPLAASLMTVEAVPGGIRIAGAEATICTLDGRTVATAASGFCKLPAGLYLVSGAGNAVKVSVR